MITVDDYPNPGDNFVKDLEEIERADASWGVKLHLIFKDFENYHVEVQGYIAMLWREIITDRVQRELLTPNPGLGVDDADKLMAEYLALVGLKEDE